MNMTKSSLVVYEEVDSDEESMLDGDDECCGYLKSCHYPSTHKVFNPYLDKWVYVCEEHVDGAVLMMEVERVIYRQMGAKSMMKYHAMVELIGEEITPIGTEILMCDHCGEHWHEKSELKWVFFDMRSEFFNGAYCKACRIKFDLE